MKYLNDAGGRFKLPLKSDAGKTLCTLLWGDPLHEIERSGERRQGARPPPHRLAAGQRGVRHRAAGDLRHRRRPGRRRADAHAARRRLAHDRRRHPRGRADDAQGRGQLRALEVHRRPAARARHAEEHDPQPPRRRPLRRPDRPAVRRAARRPHLRHRGATASGTAASAASRTATSSARCVPTPAPRRCRMPASSLKPEGKFIVELLDGKTHFGRPKRPFARDFDALAKLVGKVPKQGQQPVAWPTAGCPVMRRRRAPRPSACSARWSKSWPAAARACARWAAKASRATAIRWCCAWTTATPACCSPAT